MRIGIDARFYGPIGKGLGRYTQEVVDNIIKISSADSPCQLTDSDRGCFDYIVFLAPENFDEFVWDEAASSGRIKVTKVLLPLRWYSWSEQILLPFYLYREKLDLVHFPHFNVPIFTPTKFVVTIHDLILTHFPTLRATTLNKTRYYLKNLAYRLVIYSAVFRAKKIITVSEFTKNDLINKFKVAAKKVIVTYEGVANLAKGRDSLFVAKLDNQEILAEHHIGKNFLLYVGNAYPHKNLESLIRVFSKLHGNFPDLRLVLVGKADYFYSRLQDYARSLNLWQKNNLNSPIIFPGYVPDAQLEVLYSEARAYVFPSLYEGFGLPPLEAMAKGCPVISSTSSSLPEILGEAALYFKAADEVDMLSRIKLLLEDEHLRQSLAKKGTEQVKKYSWWQCASQTLGVYREVLNHKK